jgi:two-component system chemotaxis response regulator CheB
MSAGRVRVVVVDDSPLCAEVLRDVIERDPRFHVEAVGHDGLRAVELARTLRPTIMTMDVHMPRMNGLDAVTRIMREHPTRILLVTEDDRQGLPFEALRRGAVDVVRRPSPHAVWDRIAQDDFRARLLALAQTPLRARQPYESAAREATSRRGDEPTEPRVLREGGAAAIGIAASTGGPDALMTLLSTLPRELPLPILVVQHLAAGFVESFAGWLDRGTALDVVVATHGAPLLGGRVLIAPDGAHLRVDRARRVVLDRSPPLEGHRPSATRLFESLAGAVGPRAVGVVLTGMGRDGADGITALRAVGARSIAQDDASSVVNGMPSAARDADPAIETLSIDRIAPRLAALASIARRGVA